jgi:hypothetical protein
MPPRAAIVLLITATLAAALAAGRPALAGDNPHWRAGACSTCHEASGPAAGQARAALDEACLHCHADGVGRPCGHASPVTPAGAMLARALPRFGAVLEDGRAGCTSCHDLTLQCLASRRESRYANPTFLRGGPFRDPSEACYACHERGDYARLDPHRERPAACDLCHPDRPATARLHVSDPNSLCTGCHRAAPHPAGVGGRADRTSWAHLVVPPPEVRERMHAAEVASGVVLPLDPGSGAIVCTTCHDPHAAAQSRTSRAGAALSGPRLRRPELCGACHEL